MTDPSFMYHYTNAKVLIEIISHRKLWATHANYLNDVKEGQLTRDWICHCLDQIIASESFTEIEHIKGVFKHLLSSGRVEFITSFSKRANNLSMYRTYGPPDGGYCIGFKRDYLESIKNTTVFDIDYSSTRQINETRSFVQSLAHEVERIASDYRDATEIWRHIVSNRKYLPEFNDLCAKHKSETFHTEEEVRINLHGAYSERKLRVSKNENIFIPYAEIDLPNTVTDIHIAKGPNANEKLALTGLQQLGHIAKQRGTKWNIIYLGTGDFGYRNL